MIYKEWILLLRMNMISIALTDGKPHSLLCLLSRLEGLVEKKPWIKINHWKRRSKNLSKELMMKVAKVMAMKCRRRWQHSLLTLSCLMRKDLVLGRRLPKRRNDNKRKALPRSSNKRNKLPKWNLQPQQCNSSIWCHPSRRISQLTSNTSISRYLLKRRVRLLIPVEAKKLHCVENWIIFMKSL